MDVSAKRGGGGGGDEEQRYPPTAPGLFRVFLRLFDTGVSLLLPLYTLLTIPSFPSNLLLSLYLYGDEDPRSVGVG